MISKYKMFNKDNRYYLVEQERDTVIVSWGTIDENKDLIPTFQGESKVSYDQLVNRKIKQGWIVKYNGMHGQLELLKIIVGLSDEEIIERLEAES